MADFWRRITKRKRLITDVQGGSGIYIALSNDTVPEDAALGDLVGLLSVYGGSGTYAFTITADPDNKFAIDLVDDTRLEVDGALDYSVATSHLVTIQADNGVDPVLSRTFSITVTEVFVPANDSFLLFDQGGVTGLHLGMI